MSRKVWSEKCNRVGGLAGGAEDYASGFFTLHLEIQCVLIFCCRKELWKSMRAAFNLCLKNMVLIIFALNLNIFIIRKL